MNASNTLVDPEMAVAATEETDSQAATCELCGGEQLVDLLTAPDRFHLRTEVCRLVRCESCRAVSLAEPPKPAEMGRHYTEDYHKAIVAGGEWAGARRWK